MNPASVGRVLVEWFEGNARDLPWRRNTHPYRVWVSEIMLQQTRVETVVPYYRRWMKLFPSVRKLAKARRAQVLKAWEGLGYYARARHLHDAAKIIVGEHKGRFPEESDEWMTLPGVGDYTAAAIASITEGEPVPVVDGNVRRVVSRLLCRDAMPEGFLLQAMRHVDPGDFNEGIMELGQRICKPRSPLCPECPVRRFCRARALDEVDRWPKKKAKKKIPHQEIAVGVCRKAGKYLISRRKEDGLLGGLWEFPGGKIRSRESEAKAVAREVREEVGIEIEVGEKIITVPFRYSHFSVRLHTYLCKWKSGRARAVDCDAVRWVTLAQMRKLAFPTANRKILDELASITRK